MPRHFALPTPITQAGAALLNLIFPPACVACGRPDHELCPFCVEGFTPLEAPFCERCAQPGESPLCSRCIAEPPSFRWVRSAYRYEGRLKKAVYAFKFNGQIGVGRQLAHAAAVQLDGQPPQNSVLVPVPLSERRLAERGFNQARVLAEVLGEAWGLPVSDALHKRRDTSAQVGLDRPARQHNLSGAFSAARHVVGRPVILVDDICTTGATLNVCSRALLQAGASAIGAVTLARTP